MTSHSTKRNLVTRVGDALSIRTTELPPPPRMMTATWVSATKEGRDIALYFGQGHAGESRRLVALLVVRITAAKITEFINDNKNSEFFDSLTKRARRGITSEIDDVATAIFPNERQVFERASVMVMACSDEEAELWLYRLSPWELHRNTHTDNLDGVVQPVVGIVMGVERLMGLVTRLSELVTNDSPLASEEKIHE